jgi:4-hydroxybenzoate polyprenyltransferase
MTLLSVPPTTTPPAPPAHRLGLARALRVIAMLLRPPVALVLFLFATLGAVHADPAAAFPAHAGLVALIVGAWFVNATALNDLADEAIDRVNLPRARGRPLVSGVVTRAGLLRFGAGAGAVALAAGFALDGRVGLVVAAGLAANAAYSLPPLRLAARGGVAPLLLPLGYVGLPYLTGAWGAGASLNREDAILLAGMYVTFSGRILLKDFRDVIGDERYGKWTFLVRHGRVPTCLLSAAGWAAGSACILGLAPWRSVLAAAFATYLACALHGLFLLTRSGGWVADQVVVGAIAAVGRAMSVTLLAHYSMLGRHWSAPGRAGVVGALAALFVALYAATLGERDRAVVRPY